jgi:molybdopterin-synthase adenylyltransferase
MHENMTLLRMHKGWGYMLIADGIECWSLRDKRRLRIRGPQQPLLRLMDALRDGIPAEDRGEGVAERCGLPIQQTRNLLAEFQHKGVILRAAPSRPPARGADRDLYDPQIEFFDRWEREGFTGETLDRQLRNRRVLMVGIGGFGSWIALFVSRLGIRHLIVVDHDRVETSNLSRQVLYNAADVGRLKVEAAERLVREADPDIQYEGHAIHISESGDLLPLLDGVDLVFAPFGYLPHPVPDAIASACIQARVPYLVAGARIVGPLCIPGETPCHHCFTRAVPTLEETVEITRNNHIWRAGSRRWGPPNATLAVQLGIAAGYTVMEGVRFLSGFDTPATLGGAYMFDPLSHEVRFHPAQRDPACGLCGAGAQGS